MNIIKIKKIQRFTLLPLAFTISAGIFAADVPPKLGVVDLTPEIIRQDQRIVELEKKLSDENLLLAPQSKIKTLTLDRVIPPFLIELMSRQSKALIIV